MTFLLHAYYTGGQANTNPVQSLGGSISNTIIPTAQFNNVWPDLTEEEYSDGIERYRWIAIKNDGDEVVERAKVYFFPADEFVTAEAMRLGKNIEPELRTDDFTRPPAEEVGLSTGTPTPYSRATGDPSTSSLILPNLNPGDWIALSLKLTVPSFVPVKAFRDYTLVISPSALSTLPGPTSPPFSDPPPTFTNLDKFGVSKLYPTTTDGWESYFELSKSFSIDGNDMGDGYDEPNIPNNPEWKVSTGLDKARCTGNGELEFSGRSARFYCYDQQKQKTWQNVEFTFFGRLVSFGQWPNYGVSVKWFSTRVRSNHHMTDEKGNDSCNCNARGIKGDFHFGRDEIGVGRELVHGYSDEYTGSSTDIQVTDFWQTHFGIDHMVTNKTIGYKHVVRNRTSTGGINQQLWVDPTGTGTQFELVLQFEDGPPPKWQIESADRSDFDNDNPDWDSKGCLDADVFQAGVYNPSLLKEARACYLRTNNVFEAYISKMSIREVDPLP